MVATRAKSKKDEKKAISRPTRVRMPPGYTPPGTKTKFLPWTFAESRLRRARNYWVCSARPDGRAHAAPVWGVWLSGAFYFSTDPSSRKAKNLASNPAIVVHLESGDEVVIVEGTAAPVELGTELDAAYHRKYKMHLIGFPAPMVVFRVTKSVVLAWREKAFAASATRWAFDE